jgi:hypothetical protein
MVGVVAPATGRNPCHPALGTARERGAVLHAGERVVGQSGRGAVRSLAHFVMGGSDHPSHTVLARKLEDWAAVSCIG